MKMDLRGFLREPLVHFLVLGAALFALSGLAPGNTPDESNRIIITRSQIASIRDAFIQSKQRAPTNAELQPLIETRVREEVYYREAKALGLDKDDTVIRLRLQQKMQYLSEDLADQVQPTDAELQAFLKAHPGKFRVAQRFTFHQIFLNPELHIGTLERDTDQLLTRLQPAGRDANFAAMGDPIDLPRSFASLRADEVMTIFGDKFTMQLSELSPGQWHGPVVSALGFHVIYIADRVQGPLPALSDVRKDVSREWSLAHRLEANEQAYQKIRQRYTITIESPTPDNAP